MVVGTRLKMDRRTEFTESKCHAAPCAEPTQCHGVVNSKIKCQDYRDRGPKISIMFAVCSQYIINRGDQDARAHS